MKQFYHILCPVDFTDNSNHVIEQASFLAQIFRADLTLVHVVTSTLPQSLGIVHGMDFDSQEMMDQATEDARVMLRKAKKDYVPYAVTCKSSIQYGNTVEGILAAAEATQSDLIVMAANGVENRELMGRTALETVRRSDIPVLSIKKIDDTKGYRKILVPVNSAVGMGHVRDYLQDYFSIMAPKVTLVTVVPQSSYNASKSRMVDYLKQEAKSLLDHGMHSVEVDLIASDQPALGINAYANENGFDLIMMNAYGKSGMKELGLGTVTGDLVNMAMAPLFTIHPTKEVLEEALVSGAAEEA